MDEDDEYATITKKPLKLNSTEKKEKKRKSSKLRDDSIRTDHPSTSSSSSGVKIIKTTLTKAEEQFRAKQKEIAKDRILKKASKTHKQRVEEFNKHLDSLSEHYDIPKVSWTK